MSVSPYSAIRTRLASKTVEHYLPPTFRMRNSADESGERLRFDMLLEHLAVPRSKSDPRPTTWLLTGGAGSGKSTAVLQYAIALLDRGIPCVVVDNRTIRRLADVHGLTVKEFARQLRPAGVDEKLWKAHIKQKRVVFLVDALNELEREFEGTSGWQFVLQLVAGSHDFTVLTTSRREIDELDTVLRDVESMSIEPLGEQDIETYLEMRDGSAAEALSEIRSSDMLGLASNPFMLSLLSDWLLGARSAKDRKIPRSRADLLRETVARPSSEGRLSKAEKDAAKRGLGMEAALCAAALATITTGQGNADFLARDVEALLGRVWEDRDEITHTVKAFLDTQMVEPVGDAVGDQYSLIHPAFVDFGLALAWQNSRPPSVAHDPTYLDQCLGDWVGLQPDPDSAVLDLLARDAKQLPPELLVDIVLANRGVLSEDVRGAMWRRIGRYFSQGRQTRDRLAVALASLPPTVLREGLQRGLLRGLNAKAPELADDIFSALWNGSLTGPTLQRLRRTHERNKKDAAPKAPDRDEAATALRRTWLREKTDPSGRRRSANWLGTYGGEEDVDVLMAALLGDPDATVRGASATALGRIGAVRGLPPKLMKLTEQELAVTSGNSTDPVPWRVNGLRVLSALASALSDTDSNVRGSAANALGLIGHAQAVPALTGALADEDRVVRGSAANALGLIGHAQAVPALTAALADEDKAVRGSAANALGLIGFPGALDALTAALTDTDSNVRGSAANALGRIRDLQAVPALITALTDTDSNVRGSAANALGRISDPQAVPALTTALTDTDSNVRGSAANALGYISDPQAVPALITALTDTDSHARGSVANALGRIGDPSALDALTGVLADDEASTVRGSAAEALGRIGRSEAVPALVTALRGDPDPHTRTAAATALGRISSPSAFDALATALANDSDSFTRGTAAKALGQIKASGALAPLTNSLIHDTNDVVRGSAANALGHLGDPAAAEVLRASIGNPRETYQVRRAATGSLAHLDTGDEAWIMKVADRLKSAWRDRHARALRGAIIDLVARREITPETKAWLAKVVREDTDPLNRTAALDGLAKADQADADLIRFVIAPEVPRPDKRPRDSDAGVCGVAATAVVRAAVDQPAYAESMLPSVVRLLTQKGTHWGLIASPLTQLRLLPLPVTERVFSRIVELAGDTAQDNLHFAESLAAERELLAGRRRVQADVESFTSNPEAVLAEFREQRRSRFEVAAPKTGDEYHVALLTAVPVETKALFHVLAERGITTLELQRDGRYYDVFELTSAGQSPVRVVTTQATDQGGQSAAQVTRDLLSLFQPDLVFLIGVCGGFEERGVTRGDVLLARAVFDYSPEKVRPEGGGLRPQVYRTDPQVLRLVTRLDTRGRLDTSLSGSELLVKDFASGEKVIAWRDSELRAQLLGLSADIGGVETEAHGVLHAIWEAFTAAGFVGGAMLKCVSDLGDEEMVVDKKAKQTDAARRAARVALDVAGAFHRANT